MRRVTGSSMLRMSMKEGLGTSVKISRMTSNRSIDRRIVRLSPWVLLSVCVACVPAVVRNDSSACCRGSEGGKIVEPHVAVDQNEELLAVWATVDGEGRANIVLSRFQEQAWEMPRCVQPHPFSAVAGRQVGPRVAVGPAGNVTVAWVDRERDPAGDIYVSSSRDGGETFGAARRVNDDDASMVGQEYHDLAVAADGTLFVVWLDERGAPADYQNEKQVYVAISKDGGRTFSRNQAVTASPRGVCPCCRPGLALGPDGAVHIIYRDRVDDMLFVRLITRPAGAQEFSVPVTLSRGWRFSGCPVNGPAIAAGADGKVWALWVEGEEEECLWWARSDDGGTSFSAGRCVTPPALVKGDTLPPSWATPARVALGALPASGAFAVWEGGGGSIWTTTLPAAGERLDPPLHLAGSDERMARSPAVAVSAYAVNVCWVEETLASILDTPSAVAPGFPLHRRLPLDSRLGARGSD